jgi:hypothetical protein
MFAARRTRHLIATATLCLLLAVPWTTRAGPIIYSIQNYPPEQNGHTLSGTITTDGQIGPLAGSDITSWSVTFDDTSTFTGSGVLLQGVVQATSTSITLPAAPSNSVANLLFLVSPPVSTRQATSPYYSYGTPNLPHSVGRTRGCSPQSPSHHHCGWR